MALDVMLLANQVRDMTKLVVDGASERRRRRMMVQRTRRMVDGPSQRII